MSARSFLFTCPGEPRTWKRTNSSNGRRVTPKAQRQHQRALGWSALAARPRGWPVDARYEVTILVALSRRTRGDLDNYGKNVLDALEGVAWNNDNQVDSLRVRRALDRENPRTVVAVRVLEDADCSTVQCRVQAEGAP